MRSLFKELRPIKSVTLKKGLLFTIEIWNGKIWNGSGIKPWKVTKECGEKVSKV
jgi:hypothetical protein